MQSSPMPEGVCTTGVTASQDNAFDREPLLHGFEEAWQSGDPPSIAALLPQLSTSPAAARDCLEELVKIDLEYRWKIERSPATDELPARPLLEDYLRRFPLLGALEEVSLELIGEEYRVRRTWGDRPDRAAYRERFPMHAEALTPLLESIDAELSERVGATTLRTQGATRGAGSTVSPDGYEILGVLGRGGMGVVYQARQVRLNRFVAIKTIGSGDGAGAEELARFRAEAESAARIQHANVVQVYEVGEQNGQPFCILEYVNGGSLSHKLAGAPLEAKSAARLLETLARAVQAVHDRGILHRDLKPANVLLHLAHVEDGHKPLTELLRSPDCVPKIGDFGLARPLESSGLTRTGAVLGTPSYMAPEQADAQSEAIGPAVDVYGLGAILYELLTGRPPFRGVTVLETLDQVRNREPLPPRQLQPAVPRDVETICLKCLQKDPKKRYAGAAALADDLERFRLNRPIQARAASRWERGWKWARRRPALASLVAVLLFGIFAAAAGFVVYTVNLRSAQAETQRQQQRSAHNYGRALDAVERMLVRMGAQRIEAIPGTEKAQEDALKDAVRLYQELLDEQARPDPDLYSRLGFALTYLGNRQLALGRSDEAESNCRRGMELLDNLPAEVRDTRICQHQSAFVRYILGNILACKTQRAEAERLYLEALDILASLDNDGAESDLLIHCYSGLGALVNNPERSRGYNRQAIERSEAVYKEDPRNDYYRNLLCQCLYNLAHNHLLGRRLDEAEPLFQRCLDLLEPFVARISGTDDESAARLSSQSILLHGYTGLGMLWSSRGNADKAESLLNKAVALSEHLIRVYPHPARRQELAQGYLNLGAVFQTSRQREKAVQAYRKAVPILETLVLDLPNTSRYRLNLAASCANMSLLVERDEALSLLQKGRDMLEPLLRDHPEDPRFAGDYGNLCNNQALVLLYHDEARKALPWHDRAVEVLSAAHKRHPNDADCTDRYALCLASRAQTWSALQDFKNALADWDRVVEVVAAPDGDKYRLWRAATLIRLGDHRRAVEDIDKMLRRPGISNDERYNGACVFSLVLGAIRKDPHLSAAQRKQMEDANAARALEVLSQLRSEGYFRAPDKWLQFGKDEDWAALRARDDFKRWCEKP